MGMPEMLTARAKEVIDQADCLIGAKRMLECAKRILPGEMQEKKKMMVEYRPEQIAEIIKAEKEDWKIGILLSGDIGFFSGAKKLEKVLEGFADEVILVPGISSIVYLSAKIGIAWEDAAIISLHGKNENFIQTIDKREKTFLLLGGTDAGKVFYKRMLEYEMNEVKIHIGTNLSYADECVRSGVLSDFQNVIEGYFDDTLLQLFLGLLEMSYEGKILSHEQFIKFKEWHDKVRHQMSDDPASVDNITRIFYGFVYKDKDENYRSIIDAQEMNVVEQRQEKQMQGYLVAPIIKKQFAFKQFGEMPKIRQEFIDWLFRAQSEEYFSLLRFRRCIIQPF